MRAFVLALVCLLGCDEMSGKADQQRAEEARIKQWEGPCADKSWLLATTTGSPSIATCPNKRHHMRVQVATTASNEEVGALVFCECERDENTVDAGK